MLLVIFGAGASYDSFADESPTDREDDSRPPLANQLFSNRQIFRDTLEDFDECLPLVTRLSKPTSSLEEELGRAQNESEAYPIRHCQLAAIRFYLRRIIWEVEDRWAKTHRGVTNYKTLLDDLEHWRSQNNEEICLVTFNYDKMLERALPVVGVSCKTLDDYIRYPNWKMFKLHGSVDWVHTLQFLAVDHLRKGWNALTLMRQMIRDANTLSIQQDHFELIEQPNATYRKIDAYRAVLLFPAIAIPIINKMSFECPQAHLTALKELIPRITQILTIGWRGTEKHFLELLANHNEKSKMIPVTIVDGNLDSALEVQKNLQRAGIGGFFNRAREGFSGSLRNREVQHYISAFREYAKFAEGAAQK